MTEDALPPQDGGTYTIGKRFMFEAAHHLDGLPAGHKCARPHGHSYTVEVTVTTTAELTPPGFVVDFVELSPLGTYLRATFDHRDLNQVVAVPPTSENLARVLFDWCGQNLPLPAGCILARVRVCEPASTFAQYCGGRS